MRLAYFLCLLLAVASCKKKETQLTKITAQTIAIDSAGKASVQIDRIIAPYKEQLQAEMQQVLSYAPKDFLKTDGTMQSSLGNLMADLSIEMANPIFKEKTNTTIDFAMLNHGGIRATIPEGHVTNEHAFKLMPFDNELVVANLTGDKVMELVDYVMRNKRAHPLSHNIELTIKDTDYTLTINGKAFDKNKTYAVLTSDFLQNGGDKMNFFKNPEKLTKLDVKLRDVIIDYFKKVDTLQATLDNRVIIQ